MATSQKSYSLGVFALAMISVSAILNLREIPIMASVGLQAIFFYGLAALTFLLPSAFACAELASALPDNGGIFTWVSTAFGKKIGFLAIWMEWINNVIGFPATLATIVTTLAYISMPILAHNKYFMFIAMMAIFWGCTLLNSFGLKTSSTFNMLGAIFGTLLPIALIIIFSLIWISSGHPLAIKHEHTHVLPHWQLGSVVYFIGVLSSFAGMQVTGFHAKNVRQPQSNFPKAIFIATAIIFGASLLGSLALIVVLPTQHINLMNGIIEGSAAFLATLHLGWLTPILAALIAFGAIACLNAWVIAPARGLQNVAELGLLPQKFAKNNAHNMPTRILFLQGIIGTLLASVFLFMPTLKSAFWMLIALTSQFTLLMYILLFATVIKLRQSQPQLKRPYCMPGGKWGATCICLMGIASCVIGYSLGFFPPDQIHMNSGGIYISLVLLIDAIILGIPMLYFRNTTITDAKDHSL